MAPNTEQHRPIVRLLIFGPLIIIAAAILFYLYNYYHRITVTTDTGVVPDLIATQIDAIRFDAQGQPTYHLLSNTAQHYDQQQRTDFTYITGYYFVPTQAPWEVTADAAKAQPGFDTIYLNGHVVIQQAASANNVATRLATETLTVYPKPKTAHTDAFITLTRPGITTTSTGATLNFEHNEVQLFNHVYSIYTPISTS